jgi:hypothetical protein
MTRLVSSKIVVEWDMHTWTPHSAQVATACPLQTEHLANFFSPILPAPSSTLPSGFEPCQSSTGLQ